MYYKKQTPSKELQKFIEHYWIVKCNHSKNVREIIPNVNISVCYYFAKCQYKIIDKDCAKEIATRESFLEKIKEDTIEAQCVIIGPHKNAIIETSENEYYTFGIEFKTGFSQEFCGIPMENLCDNIINIHSLDCKLFINIEDILNNCNPDNIFDTIDDYLLNNFLSSEYAQIEDLEWFEEIRDIRESPFNQKITDLAGNTYCSERTYNRKFKATTGLSPKQFIMIQRKKCAIDTMMNNPNLSLAEIAELCGYYDHSQMNKQFCETGGIPATQVFENMRARLVFSPSPLCYNIIDDEGYFGLL